MLFVYSRLIRYLLIYRLIEAVTLAAASEIASDGLAPDKTTELIISLKIFSVSAGSTRYQLVADKTASAKTPKSGDDISSANTSRRAAGLKT